MINALWLILIVPAAAFFGFAVCACLTVAKQADERAGME